MYRLTMEWKNFTWRLCKQRFWQLYDEEIMRLERYRWNTEIGNYQLKLALLSTEEAALMQIAIVFGDQTIDVFIEEI